MIAEVDFRIVQPTTAEDFRRYFHFRWQLLRAPWDQAEGSESDDIENQCFHLMAKSRDDNVIAVARLQFNSPDEAQLRYMAVAKSHEKKGIGMAIIETIEDHAIASRCPNIVLDSRESAVGFYEKLGYQVSDTSYLLFDEIQHYRMMKKVY